MVEMNGWSSEQLCPKIRVVLGIALIAAGLSCGSMGFFSLWQATEHVYVEVDAGNAAVYTEVTGLCVSDPEYFLGFSQPFYRVSGYWPDRLESDSARFACRVP